MTSIARRCARLVLSLALVLSPLAGCSLRAPAGRYNKDDVAFDHLAGWSVAKDTQTRGARTIIVEGPTHAILTISVFAPDLDVSLKTFVSAATKGRAAAIKNSVGIVGGAEADTTPTAPTERAILGTTVSGLKQHFTMELLGAHVPHTVQYFLARIGRRAVIYMDQVPDADRASVDAGFQKIFDTVSVGRVAH